MLDKANAPVDTPRCPKASLVLGFTIAWMLACGGMTQENPQPTPTEADEPADEHVDAVAPETDPETETAQPAAEELFTKLDVDEPPLTRAPTCPKGTSVIRHPRGRVIEVYCATHAGKKQGVWTQWRHRTLLATRTYELGIQEGVGTTWSKEEEQGPRKRSQSSWKGGEQHGAHAEWNAEGTLLVRGAYHAGKRHGRFLERDGTQDPPAFAGTCYEAGETQWHTSDPVAFATDPCSEPAKL